MRRRISLSNAYISSALFCGGDPKLAASEVGHTTARRVLETYDSFIDPANWPGEEKREVPAVVISDTYFFSTAV